MYRSDFIKKVADRAGFIQSDVRAVLDAVGEEVENLVRDEEKVTVFEGLVVEGVRVDAKNRTNYFTGEPIFVDEHIRPKVRFTDNFKDKVRVARSSKTAGA